VTVTIKQVAREAGVSVATVSRALNHSGPVREELRKRILAVSERLRYVPHSGARSLITRKTGTIGVVLPDIHGEFFSEVIRGMDGVSRHHGYHLLVSSSHGDTAATAALVRATRGRVDGLVVMAPDLDTDAFERDVPATRPIVVLNCRRVSARFDSISIDNYGGAFAMVRHLASLGHRRIAFVKGPIPNFEASERLRGFRDAIQAAGHHALEIDGDFSEEAGRAGALAARALRPRPTAIFAANDSMAIGALVTLVEAGIQVPEEMAVVGFDDIPAARYVSPPLTSVHVPIAELGSRAMERLLLAFESGDRHSRNHEVLPTTLIVRRSCGADGAAAAHAPETQAEKGRDARTVRERRRQ